MIRLVDIVRDPNGIYVGRDAACNLYWYSASVQEWFLIKLDDCEVWSPA